MKYIANKIIEAAIIATLLLVAQAFSGNGYNIPATFEFIAYVLGFFMIWDLVLNTFFTQNNESERFVERLVKPLWNNYFEKLAPKFWMVFVLVTGLYFTAIVALMSNVTMIRSSMETMNLFGMVFGVTISFIAIALCLPIIMKIQILIIKTLENKG